MFELRTRKLNTIADENRRNQAISDYRECREPENHHGGEVQKFMEDSALVIVDIDKAIEDGFVKISKDFMEQYGKEHGNDAE